MSLPATADVRALLGRRVRVRLDDTGQHIVTGQLLGFGEGGDFEIRDEADLMVHYCWPMLHIEPADG
jgi:hypothetical protein